MTHDADGPIGCTQCGKEHTRCRGHTSGEPCRRYPRRGAKVCDSHGGRAPQVRAKAAVRAEVMAWGLGDTLVDPGEVLLRLVSQSAARCELYSRLLGEAYEAADRLRDAEDVPEHDGLAAESARLDLERILNHGAVGVLVGNVYAADKQAGIFATGEAIRGLVKLEKEERELCANLCTKAIAAGLAERTVRLAEQAGALLAQILRDILADPIAALSEQQVAACWSAAGRVLQTVAGTSRVIEGRAA